jgi:hypothetical protein
MRNKEKWTVWSGQTAVYNLEQGSYLMEEKFQED